jgi:hypothetical protein
MTSNSPASTPTSKAELIVLRDDVMDEKWTDALMVNVNLSSIPFPHDLGLEDMPIEPDLYDGMTEDEWWDDFLLIFP